MNPLEIAYGASIGVVITIAVICALHPRVPTGIVGTVILGGIVLCELAATERYGETPNWRVLLTILEGCLALWMAAKWLRRRG